MNIGIPEIDHKYEILELMGEGGMGSIYRARHRYLDEIRVIKTIRPQLRSNEELQARFLQEAKVAAKLRHPNIAAIYDFTMTEDGLACIVMEHIEGRNLRQLNKEQGRIALRDLLTVSKQILGALGYLHDQQFVHRDISTDNVMLSVGADGEPKATLIDLGLAKSLEAPDSHTKTGMVIGKLHYISPEQLSRGMPGVVIDGRCDLYAFGIVLYELLTHRQPIQGDDQVSLIAGHLHRPPRSFEETDPTGSIPEGLRTVIMKALAKKPDDRFPDAASMAVALEAVASTVAGAEPEEAGKAVVLSEWAVTAVTKQTLPGKTQTIDSGGFGSMFPRTWTVVRQLVRQRKRVLIGLVGAVAAVAVGMFGWRMLVEREAGGARDGKREAASAVTAEAALPDVFFGTSHALLIGNNTYQALPRLETAVNDVRAVGEVLRKRYGFTVTVLENASRKETIDRLSEIAVSMTARDNLLVYYAGHGNIQFGRESWQPIDAAPDDTSLWISTQHEVSAPLSRSAARHVLVISDSCYAGASAEAALAPEPVEIGDHETVRRLAGRTSRLVMTSGGLAPVLDQGDGHLSIFAKALIGVLEDGDGLLATSEIFARLEPRVAQAAQAFSFEQHPTLAAIPRAGDEGGELFFVPASG